MSLAPRPIEHGRGYGYRAESLRPDMGLVRAIRRLDAIEQARALRMQHDMAYFDMMDSKKGAHVFDRAFARYIALFTQDACVTEHGNARCGTGVQRDAILAIRERRSFEQSVAGDFLVRRYLDTGGLRALEVVNDRIDFYVLRATGRALVAFNKVRHEIVETEADRFRIKKLDTVTVRELPLGEGALACGPSPAFSVVERARCDDGHRLRAHDGGGKDGEKRPDKKKEKKKKKKSPGSDKKKTGPHDRSRRGAFAL